MTSVKHRTSFALDEATLRRLRRLASRWNVSLAEVVRRAIKLADDQVYGKRETVTERLAEYRAARRLDSDAADRYLSEVAEDRARWEGRS
jgi:hypothetical protein